MADRIAGGDLTVEAGPLSDKDTPGLALRTMAPRLGAVVGAVMAVAGQVSAFKASAGSHQLSASAERLSQVDAGRPGDRPARPR